METDYLTCTDYAFCYTKVEGTLNTAMWFSSIWLKFRACCRCSSLIASSGIVFTTRMEELEKNIPLDFRKEQLNKVLKTTWRSLGSNINEKNAFCVANTLEMMEKILESIDKDCSYTKRHGNRNIKNEEAAVTQISSDLMGKHVFKFTPGRQGHE